MNESVETQSAADRALLRQQCQTWDGFFALGFGSGLAPRAPGTAGTLAAVPLAFAIKMLPPVALALVIIVAFLFGVWICGRVGERLGVSDHGAIVWDEFVGFWLAIALVPASWEWILAGFVLFRLFDILKPWPIGPVDRRVKGGLGVMLDDMIAGALALAVLWVAQVWLVPWSVSLLPGS